ncbi:ribosomal protein S18 [Didymella exigua CBS 183.55]|uniref:Small ribosomal subunit protein bS18m n=1 Tax=Didymella exigua CBS 183.55 TaxID=1150837 RepID=A0A6A5RRZ0_9PLEO|nr:ribosomal protein S18 [Didymella exigua CBS 183.55]KAF1930389.1 ribosomal protein S18 [Didymella exigua CBS 183.55]
MSLPTRLLRFRAPNAAASRTSLRCFSSGTPKQRGEILNILSESSAARPSAPKNPIGSTLATRMARDAGLSERPTQTREMVESERRAQFQRQIYRRWQTGDIYSPHDLTGAEQKKWKYGRKKPQSDAFDVLGINPINEYKNFTIMSEYMTEMGRIKHSKDTGLRPKNQRKIAKAIRRAIGLGLMPSVHRHPLVLKGAKPSQFM